MDRESSGLSGDTGEGTIEVPIGVIPPCNKYKQCMIAHAQLGSMAIEWKGNMYFIGNMLCFRCTHLKKTDLFEDLDNRLIANHPDAEEIIGVTPDDVLKMQKSTSKT